MNEAKCFLATYIMFVHRISPGNYASVLKIKDFNA